MTTFLILVTVVSVALAIGMAVLLARLLREDRERSDARVAALAEMAIGPEALDEPVAPVTFDAGNYAAIDLSTAGPEMDPIDDAGRHLHPSLLRIDSSVSQANAGLFAPHDESSPWGRRVAVAGALAGILAAAVLVGTAGRAHRDDSPAASATAQTKPLELLALHHARDGGSLTISGVVKNPAAGAPVLRVVATAYVFGPDGAFLTSGRAPLDRAVLPAGDQSSFVIKVPVNGDVARYRVGFRTEDGTVVSHVDKRTPDTLASTAGTAMKSVNVLAFAAFAAAAVLMGAHPEGQTRDQQQPGDDTQSFRFRTGVELINVNATVTDENGRFVPNLRQDDFRVYQDGELQPITHFNAERVPVSLGIALDTSGSMDGEKMAAARDALDRFLAQLLESEDEVFLFPVRHGPGAGRALDEGQGAHQRRSWPAATTRRDGDVRRCRRRRADGAEGREPQEGAAHHLRRQRHQQQHDIQTVKRLIRETDVLVYAIGIDGEADQGYLPIGMGQGGVRRPRPQPPRMPSPFPFPMPGGRRPPPGGGTIYPPPRGGNNRSPATNESTWRRCGRSRTTAAAAPRSSAARATSIRQLPGSQTN